jgi:hypothetical protein
MEPESNFLEIIRGWLGPTQTPDAAAKFYDFIQFSTKYREQQIKLFVSHNHL